MIKKVDTRKRITLRLSASEISVLTQIGEGNAQAGVNILIAEATESGRDKMRVEVTTIRKLIPREVKERLEEF